MLHVIFYFTDSLPLFQTVFSITCHIVYLQNFSNTWPLISLTSLSFLASCVLVISDHFIWFFYFARITSEARSRQYRSVQPEPPGFTEIASFFAICVWYTPLFLFLSLSANDNALPMTAGKSYSLEFLYRVEFLIFIQADPSSPTGASPVQTAQSRVSLIRTIFNYVSFEGTIPRIRSRPSRKDGSEGLLAPHSPLPQVHRSASPALRTVSYAPPPRSPGPRVQEILRGQELEVNPSPSNSNFRLGNVPRGMPVRQASRDALGLGINLRRTASFAADDQ